MTLQNTIEKYIGWSKVRDLKLFQSRGGGRLRTYRSILSSTSQKEEKLPHIDEHEETVTLLKQDYEKMVSLMRQAKLLLTIANEGLIKIDRGVRSTNEATKNDKSNTISRRSGTTTTTSKEKKG